MHLSNLVHTKFLCTLEMVSRPDYALVVCLLAQDETRSNPSSICGEDVVGVFRFDRCMSAQQRNV
jgi:hypothetical protein